MFSNSLLAASTPPIHTGDHSTPAPLRSALKDHVVAEAFERGWDTPINGDLLSEAEAAGFPILITADGGLRVSAAERSSAC